MCVRKEENADRARGVWLLWLVYIHHCPIAVSNPFSHTIYVFELHGNTDPHRIWCLCEVSGNHRFIFGLFSSFRSYGSYRRTAEEAAA